MAPRGGRNDSRSSRPARDAKSKTTSTRGGISKRKGVPGRVDTDGDLDMDTAARKLRSGPAASSTRGRGTTRGSSTKTRGAARGTSRALRDVLQHIGDGDASSLASRIGKTRSARGPPLSYLRIHGLKQSKAAENSDGGLSGLVGFLERKASGLSQKTRPVRIKKSQLAGDYVFVGASAEDAEAILKVNTFQFAGAELQIVESTEELSFQSKATESKDTQELRAKLQGILSQRYIAPNKLLKLDALAADADLVRLGMFETRDRALKTFKGLMAICDSLFKTAKEKQDAVESISLANNSIDDVKQVEMVATTFPQLKNLDMSGNQISNMQGLDRWKGKFRDLDTIYTAGNPIETTEPNFQAALLDMFPKLRIINGAELRTAEQIVQQAAAANSANPIPQNGPDFRDMNGIGENFLLEFFAAYDSNRQELANKYYDESSQFSLAVDAVSVRDPNAPPPVPWQSYLKASRNLIKITTPNAQIQRLFKGANLIGQLWNSLPATRHPNIKEELSKYIMDCHPLTGLADPSGQNPMGVDGLIICVHGEFEEHDQKTDRLGKRSFSRSFVLGPGLPGQGPIRVLSDMLSLRAFSPLPNVFVAATQQAPEPPNQQQAMVAELSRQTNMVPEYSKMCLEQVNWDFNQAVIMFQEKKAQLPAEAFATAT